jgi:hypothetical protein
VSLQIRYSAYLDIADLNEVAHSQERAVLLLQNEGSLHAAWTSTLAFTYYTLWKTINSNESRELAMKYHLSALELFSEGDARKPSALMRCSMLLTQRYWVSNTFEDAEESVRMARLALSLMDAGHVMIHQARNTLFLALRCMGTAHKEIFRRRKDQSMAHLEDSIVAFRENVRLCPLGTRNHDVALNELGVALVTLHTYCGDRAAGDEALKLYQCALDACPQGHPRRYISLRRLAKVIQYLSTTETCKHDYTVMSSLLKEALALTPPGHPSRVGSLIEVAELYRTQYSRTKKKGLLVKSFAAIEEAMRTCPRDNELRLGCLLGYLPPLLHRYHDHGDLDDLDQAERTCHEYIDMVSPEQPELFKIYSYLISLHISRGAEAGTDAALKFMLRMVETRFNDVRSLMRAVLAHLPALRKRALSEGSPQEHRHVLLHIHRKALELIPQIAHTGLDVTTRLQDLRETEQLAVDAAVVALFCSRLDAAIECLEDGRAMFWAQGLALRASYRDGDGASRYLPVSRGQQLHFSKRYCRGSTRGPGQRDAAQDHSLPSPLRGGSQATWNGSLSPQRRIPGLVHS